MSKINSHYYTWKNMLSRCYNPSNPSYKNYGGRGINVCSKWRLSLETFSKDMGTRPQGMTLERVNNDAGYSKENCIWADRTVQNRNRRKQPSKIIQAFGEAKDINEWSEQTGIKVFTIYKRLHRGWSNERAVSV